MFRKILIAVAASLALLTPLALPAQSEAHGPRDAHRQVHRQTYHVYSRGCSREAWHCVGTYTCREDAFRQVQYLRSSGNEAFLR